MRLRRSLPVLAACVLLLAAGFAAAAEAAHHGPRHGVCKPGAKACLKAGARCVSAKRKVYEKAGFACVKGRLRKRAHATTTATVPKTTTAATTPAPVALPTWKPGHYTGTTSQHHPIQFDVDAAGTTIANVVGGASDETCTPTRPYSFVGFDVGAHSYTLDEKGGLTIRGKVTNGNGNGASAATRFVLAGAFDGKKAYGTLTVATTLTGSGGNDFACRAAVTWSAKPS